MIRNATRVVLSLVVLLTTGALATGSAGVAGAQVEDAGRRPIIFVHGFAGSGSQFEAQAMRFASNGYPVGHIEAHEYDSLFNVETQDEVFARLDERIAALVSATGADQVDLLGHSLGTGLMQAYLNSDPARAARVAHYVNLDGASAAAPPGGVPTMAVWGMGDPARQIAGATNVYFGDQSHTQVVTSPETFAAVYEFFNGEAPSTVNVVRQRAGQITIAGRALLFISNVGVQDAELNVYEVDGETGGRVDSTAEATYALGGDGSWGPLSVDPEKHYEFELSRATGRQHIYVQPFVRTNRLVRLLSSEPGAGVDALWDKGEGHANLAIIRNKEWWGDQGGDSDALAINGTDVINAATTPQSKRAIGIFVYDEGADGASDVSMAVPAFFALPFLTAVDLYLPAATPPDGVITLAATPRLGTGVETINVPNFASSTDRVSVQFRDFHQTDPPIDDEGAPGTTAATPSTEAVSPSFTG
jgi:pimeloyl-ACP methyl ester carboxylesterase